MVEDGGAGDKDSRDREFEHYPRVLICINDSGGILETSGVRVFLCGSYLTW